MQRLGHNSGHQQQSQEALGTATDRRSLHSRDDILSAVIVSGPAGYVGFVFRP